MARKWGAPSWGALLLMWVLLPARAVAGPIVWVGVDYGLVQMIGTQDFRDPGAIFPGYLQKWNVLVLQEQLDDLQRRLRTPLVADVEGLIPLLNEADPERQIVRNDLRPVARATLSPKDIQARVKRYTLTHDGLALVFVADRLHKPGTTGCYWVTFFDAATRHMRSTEQRCGDAGGFGFRNYWFGTVKSVIKTLRRTDVPG